jgi:hypothetical protein
MTKLYIDNDLKLRAHPNGWPVEPSKLDFFDTCDIHGASRRVYVGGDFGYEKAFEKYTTALAKAKKESILAGEMYISDPKPDSFIDFNGSMNIVCQALQGDVWADVIPKYYDEMKNKQPDRFRKFARLNPQNSAITEVFSRIPAGKFDQHYKGEPRDNSAHGYSEGSDVNHYYEKAHTAENDITEEFTVSQQKCCDLMINELMQKWHMPMGQARDVGRDVYFRFIYNRKYESEVHDLQQQLDAANKKIKALQDFVTDIKKLQIDLKAHHEEYVDSHMVEPNPGNSAVFRGKADAYGWASSRVMAAIKWHAV